MNHRYFYLKYQEVSIAKERIIAFEIIDITIILSKASRFTANKERNHVINFRINLKIK